MAQAARWQAGALLVLAHLRNGDTLAVWRSGSVSGLPPRGDTFGGVDLLASAAPTLQQFMLRVAALVYAILPGATHDLTAARQHCVIDALNSANVVTFADKGYQGVSGIVRTPFKRHPKRLPLSRRQKEVNRAHARVRALGERAIATLKTWKVLAKLRCCPRRATAIVQAILVLQAMEDPHHTG
ncbi:hypothetical protein Asi02nite_30850 [Asanoa siamensis]|uniref:DDE Tnp4 domain-containing protein n=1 Tax=Asanoa siamensis TaxID=926357 RepID=A0ABQ4CRU3_9ACTN|nr:hypothetical protein Asi02nite_30850 [Asanoa siamensis]